MNATIIDSQNKQICDRIRPLLTWHFCAKKNQGTGSRKGYSFFSMSIFLFVVQPFLDTFMLLYNPANM